MSHILQKRSFENFPYNKHGAKDSRFTDDILKYVQIIYRRTIVSFDGNDEQAEGCTSADKLFWKKIETFFHDITSGNGIRIYDGSGDMNKNIIMAIIEVKDEMDSNVTKRYIVAFSVEINNILVSNEHQDLTRLYCTVLMDLTDENYITMNFTKYIASFEIEDGTVCKISCGIAKWDDGLLRRFVIDKTSNVVAIFGKKYDVSLNIQKICSLDTGYKTVVGKNIYDSRGKYTGFVKGYDKMDMKCFSQYIEDDKISKNGLICVYLVNLKGDNLSSDDTNYWYFAFFNEYYPGGDFSCVCILSGIWGQLSALYRTMSLADIKEMKLPYYLGFSDTTESVECKFWLYGVTPYFTETKNSFTDFREVLFANSSVAKGSLTPYIQSVSEDTTKSIADYKRFIKLTEVYDNMANTFVQVCNGALFMFSPTAMEYGREKTCTVWMLYKIKSEDENETKSEVMHKVVMTLNRNDNVATKGSLDFKKKYLGGNTDVLNTDELAMYYGFTSTRAYNIGNCNLPELQYFNVPNESYVFQMKDGDTENGYIDIFGKDFACTLINRDFFVSYCYSAEPKLWIDPSNPQYPVYYSDGSSYEYMSQKFELTAVNRNCVPSSITIGEGVATITKEKDVGSYINTTNFRDKIIIILFQVKNIDAIPGNTDTVYFDKDAGLKLDENGSYVRKTFYMQMVLDGTTYMNNDPNTNGRRLLVRYNSGKNDVRTHTYYCVNGDPAHGFKITNQNAGDFTIVFGNSKYDYQFMIDKHNLIFPANMLYSVYSESDGWDVRDTSCDLYLTDYKIMAVYTKGAVNPVLESTIMLYTNDNHNITADLPSDFNDRFVSYVQSMYNTTLVIDDDEDWKDDDDITLYKDIYVSYDVGENTYTVHYNVEYEEVYLKINTVEILKYDSKTKAFIRSSVVEVYSSNFSYYDDYDNCYLGLDVFIGIKFFNLTFYNKWYNCTPNTIKYNNSYIYRYLIVLASDRK